MPRTYLYRARDLQGRVVQGRMEADTPRAVAAALRARRCFATEVRPAGGGKPGLWPNVSRKGKLRTRELAIFCRQLATMIGAGVPLLAALDTLKRQAESAMLRNALGAVITDVDGGRPLSQALGALPRIFPRLLVSMVQAGEAGGVLETALSRMAEHFEREHDLREKVKTAMTYPLVLLAVGFLAVGFLITFVLPTFIDILSAMGVPLPLPTVILLAVSGFLTGHWHVVLLTLGGAILGLGQVSRQYAARRTVDALALRLPLFGPLLTKMGVSRFCRTLATLSGAGVPLLAALEIVEGTTGNLILGQVAADARDAVSRGQELAGVFSTNSVIPPLVGRMVAVGEETGSLDRMLEKVADFYDRETNATVARLSSLLEPVLLVFMGALVGTVVLAILWPMFKVISGVGLMTGM